MPKSRAPSTSEIDITKQTASQAVAPRQSGTKIDGLVGLLRRPGGAHIDEMMALLGWQAHSVRGAIAGTLKKKLGLNIVSEKIDGVRTYRIAAERG